jgi:hypothetical protein
MRTGGHKTTTNLANIANIATLEVLPHIKTIATGFARDKTGHVSVGCRIR